MNAAFDTKGMSVLRSVAELNPTLEAQLHAMRRDSALSTLLEGKMTEEAPVPGKGALFSGGQGGCSLLLHLWIQCLPRIALDIDELAPPPAPTLPAGGNYTWGSPLWPWEIAANGRRFVQDKLRMEDTLLYIR